MERHVGSEAGRRWRRLAGAALLWAVALGLAVVARYLYDNPTSFIDEYYHVVAASSMRSYGDFKMARHALMPYDRAAIFTEQVVWSFRLLGENLRAARVPSVVWGVVLVGAMFGWLRAVVGRWAERTDGIGGGWLGSPRLWVPLSGAVLVGFALELVNYSVFVRFYMMHAALVALATAAAWTAASPLTSRGFWSVTGSQTVEPPRGRAKRLIAAAVCLGCLALAMRLQVTTVFAAAGIAAWAAAAGLAWWVDVWWDDPKLRRRGAVLAAAAALGVAGVAAAAWFSGWIGEKWIAYRATFPWGEATRDDVGFYLRWLRQQYDWMLLLLPAAIVAAVVVRRWAALLMLSVFTAVLVGQSFGGLKADRYLLQGIPMFLGIWALAAGFALAAAGRLGHLILGGVGGRLGFPRQVTLLGAPALALGLVLAAAYGLYRTPGFYRTGVILAGELTGDGAPMMANRYRYAGWDLVADPLREVAASAEVVVSSSSPPTLFHLRRHDVGLNADTVYENTRRVRESHPERAAEPLAAIESPLLDWRLGTPVIDSVRELAAVMRSGRSGLIVVEAIHWRQDWAVSDAVADHIEANAKRVSLPAGSGVIAFTWG